jgi:hypothetical protein
MSFANRFEFNQNPSMRNTRFKPAIITALAIALTLADIGVSLSKPKPDGKISVIHNAKQAIALHDMGTEKSHFSLPFHLVDGYILIDGEVNNKSGKFMFDTGTPFAIFLNNHFVPLTNDVYQSKGSAASGQSIIVYAQNYVDSVKILDQLQFQHVKLVPHADFGFIEEGAVQNYLGFIGHGFNKDYLFIIDYDKQTIDLFLSTQEHDELPNVIKQDKLVAKLDFSSRGDGRIPEVEFTIGSSTITGKFDTGNQGTLTLTKAMKDKLESEGYLLTESRDYWYGAQESHPAGVLKKLSYQNKILTDIHNLRISIGEVNEIGLGYQFLKNYVSAWDYHNKTITLMRR